MIFYGNATGQNKCLASTREISWLVLSVLVLLLRVAGEVVGLLEGGRVY